jgi:AraC-like DNA-binding protein
MTLIDQGGYERISPKVSPPLILSVRGDQRSVSEDINLVIAQTTRRRVDVYNSLVVRSASGEELTIAHLSRSTAGHGPTELQARSETFVVCTHLEAFNAYDVWCDGKHDSSCAIGAGSVHINDMRHSWNADIRGAFQVVNFCIPQTSLDDLTDDQGASRIEDLHCPMREAHVDPVLRNLALALIPALTRPDQMNRLFVSHTWLAVITHVARAYGSLRVNTLTGRGGLAPWQERRAKEMLAADLSGCLTLPELAAACRLSCSHFSQAFRQTVGCPPHQWLMIQRVERSKDLMLNTDKALSEIALVTGFADQSHFTRVFSQRVGRSPAAWRRAQSR